MNAISPIEVEADKEAVMPPDRLWYKDAIIYQLHIKAFFDSNNDGIGDFAGLTEKLDYLQELGVTAVWVLPFYPSPLRDDGYDIADYCNVNPSYGNLKNFQVFIQEAHKRNLRVITELVVNHTSDQHQWFQRARNAPAGSSERNYYVWSDTDQKYQGTRIIFSDTETSNWTWDPVAKAYYWHRFFSHQPDLNFDNSEVLQNIIEVMYFWLDMGVDGMRLDAVPYLCEREGTNNENLPETHAILKKIRTALDERYPDRMLLAEANQWPEDVLSYFGQGDECHMAFHFPLMPRIYMAVAQEDRHPITDIMYQTPVIPENCQWALFLRNHDELTLEMVTDRERDYLWNFYAADKRARINFGIRRRLAPLMENDRRKIELLNSLLLSMPGTPVIYYGDELGMGDNIYLGDRDGVRTPMQWSPDRNGGFSRSDPARLYLPAIMDPVYGFQSVNVETQRRAQYSLLNWTRNLIAVVKTTRIFSRGALRFLVPSNRAVLAYMREDEGEHILCVANLSRSPQAVELDMKAFNGLVPLEMLGQSRFPAIGELPYFLTLAPYGFYWFKLNKDHDQKDSPKMNPELFTLVLPDGWDRLFNQVAQDTLQQKLLPAFLLTRRWYKGKHAGAPNVDILDIVNIGAFRLLFIRATPPNGAPQYYTLGFGIAWDDGVEDPLAKYPNDVMCRVRRFNRVGVFHEAMQQEHFIADILAGFGDKPPESLDSKLVYKKYAPMPKVDPNAINSLGAEQTNSSALVGDSMIIKFIRQAQPDLSLEEEYGSHFAAIKTFDRVPKLLGAIGLESGNQHFTIALVQEAIRNQGDGWAMTLNYLENFVKDADIPDNAKKEEIAEDHYYTKLAHQLGLRTGELHKALSAPSRNADFKPEAMTEEDRAQWLAAAIQMAERAMNNLHHAPKPVLQETRALVDKFLNLGEGIAELLRQLLPVTISMPKIRVHGDYHLGQVLVAENDFYIIDFEGEPARPVEDRRKKTSPLKDVAGMMRSFDYASASALRSVHLGNEERRPHIVHLLKVWRNKTDQAFLDGYRKAITYQDDMATQDSLLRFFKLEKALYEVVYESEHRPDWLDIPLRSVFELLQAGEA